MPPRHGKSELVSRLFTAYWLHRHPEQWVGLCSYGAELANTLSRAARDNYLMGGGAIRDDASAVKHWETAAGGGLWAAGVGGPITGKGWHLGVIDDPVKNSQEAASRTLRDAQREWYQSTFYTREEPDPNTDQPDGALIVIQTRWAEDDLAGWLLAEETAAGEVGDDEGLERWHVVNLEAIKEAEPPAIPPSCTAEPDWRQPGEALCPERRPLDKLERIRRKIGAYFFAALFQQRPRPREGKVFRREWFSILDRAAMPRVVEWVRHWDLAATEETDASDPDWTAGALLGRTADDRFVIADLRRLRGSPAAVDRLLAATAREDRAAWGHVRISLEQEPGASGKRVIDYFITRVLAGYDVFGEPATGSKIERARILASQAEAGNVLLIAGPWVCDFLDELVAFPTGGVHDDQVDAASGAIGQLCDLYSAGAF